METLLFQYFIMKQRFQLGIHLILSLEGLDKNYILSEMKLEEWGKTDTEFNPFKLLILNTKNQEHKCIKES